MKYIISISLFAFSMSAIADIRWRDEKSGTRFLLLSGLKTFGDAHRACRSKGWDLFNFEYLSEEEQQRFLSSRELDSLTWESKLKGEPGERTEATIWGSSEFGAIVTHGSQSSGKSGLFLQRFADETVTRGKVKWGSDDEARSTICMYQSHTWEGCSHELQCTYENQGGGTFKIRYAMYEYGPHKRDALNRLKDRVKNFEGGIGGRCELAPKDPWCLSYR